jgi:hypothetical protein
LLFATRAEKFDIGIAENAGEQRHAIALEHLVVGRDSNDRRRTQTYNSAGIEGARK